MAAITRRAFAGAAAQTTITAGINSSDLSIPIAAATGWPSGASFYVVIDPGQSSEEKVLCTRSGTTLTVASTSQRGVDGTAAASHSSGAVIYPCVAAADLDEANQVAATLTTKGDLLGFGTSPTRIQVGANGLTLLADSSDSEGVAWGQVDTAGIKDNAVTADKIAANAVGAFELANDAVDTAAIANDAVTNDKLADDAVDSPQIADGAVDNVHLSTDINPVSLRVGVQLADVFQAIGGGGSAEITWGIETVDTHGFHTSGGRVTVPAGRGGLYIVSVWVQTASTSDHHADLWVAGVAWGFPITNDAVNTTGNLTTVVPLDEGDEVYLDVWNTTGSSVQFSSRLSVFKIGA